MRELRHDFVFEALPVDAVSAAAGAGWVAGLEHEGFDYPVDGGLVVVRGGGEGGEVVACLWGGGLVWGCDYLAGNGYYFSSFFWDRSCFGIRLKRKWRHFVGFVVLRYADNRNDGI